MPPPGNPNIENPQGQRAGADTGPQIRAGDLDRRTELADRPRTPEASTETISKPLDRQQATNNLGDIGDRNANDPQRNIERAREPYKIPEQRQERENQIKAHRESTSTTGFNAPRTYYDESGKAIRGVESFDKKTGQKVFYEANKEGGYTPYQVQDGGKSLHKLDQNLKPTGEQTKVAQGPNGFREREIKAAQDSDLKAKTPAAEKGSEKGTDKPGGEKPGTPEKPNNTNPGETPGRGFPKREPQAELIKPQVQKDADSNPQGYRPHQKFRDGEDPGKGRGYNDDRPQKSLDRPQQQWQPKPEQEHPQGFRPYDRQRFQPEAQDRPVIRPQERPEFSRPHNPHEMAERPNWRGPQDRVSLPQQVFVNPGEGGRPQWRPQEIRHGNMVDAPLLQGRISDNAAAWAALRQLGSRDFVAAGQEGGLRTFSGQFRPGELSGLRSFGDGRADLSPHFLNNLRINPDLLSNTSRSFGQAGDLSLRGMHTGMRQGLESGRTLSGEQIAGARDLNSSRLLVTDAVARQLGRVLDFMSSRNENLDKVPTQDQSRLVMREFFRNPRLDQITTQDQTNAMLVQRTLNMRNMEQQASQQQNFTTKGIHNAELVARVKEADITNRDAKPVESNRTLPQDRNLQDRNLETKTNTTVSARVIESNNAAGQQADQAKARRDVAEAKETSTNTQQQTQTERQIYVESKTDSQVRNVNDSSKYGSNEDKKNNNKEEEEEAARIRKQKEKQEKDDLLSPEEMALFLNKKLKEQSEKDKGKGQEQENAQDKKDPKQKTRIKYRVKEGDTLATIAAKFLSDSTLAAAIFHINRTVIPITTYEQKSYAIPPQNLLIWIPCDDDIDIFKSSGAGKRYVHIGFEGLQYANAQDELAARFGRRWFGPAEQEAQKQSQASAVDQNRRRNIENMLGPLDSKALPEDGRIRYVVRLGEGLKSIALKHPLLSGVELWKLLACVNGMSTETDERGFPVATLKRGMTLLMPTPEEVANFRLDGTLPQLGLQNLELDNDKFDTVSSTRRRNPFVTQTTPALPAMSSGSAALH